MDSIIDRLAYLKKIVPVRQLDPTKPLMILIDPGHGGMVNGKYTTAPNKMFDHGDFVFYEGVYNRLIAYELALQLRMNNYSYHILVPEDTDPSVYERVRRAETIKKEMKGTIHEKMYYHSIHGNAFGLENVSGVEVFTSPGYTKADPLATIYFHHLAQLGWKMRPDWSDGDPDKEEKFHVLVNSTMPALLSETGFYTNYEEAKLMLKIDTVQAIAHLFLMAHSEIIKLKLI